MRMKKPAVVLATAALMTLAACGGGSGTKSSSNDATMGEGGNAGSFKNADAKAPATVPDDAAQGGTFTVLTNQVPATLDPTQAYYADSTAILSDLVIRSLTQYAYDEDSNDMQLIPDMATDLGRPNEDNKEWTFTLRDGLKYEDGTPVKAEDVAYAIKRSFAIAELPDGPTYQTTFFLDGDKYKGPFKDKGEYKGVEVKGNDITIKMRRPFTDMDYYASFPAFTAIPQAKDNPETYGKNPMATGPYKFADYKPGSELKLVKNDQWDPNTDPGRIQAVDGWDFKFGQDTAKLENVIINDKGSAQTTLTYDNVSPSSYRPISSDKNRLVTGTSPCTYMWFIDMTKVKDLDVRKAIGWAYPYEAAWKAGGEVEGVTRVPGTAILPPGTAGRKDYDALGNKGKTTDPAKAKELLKKAGYAPGSTRSSSCSPPTTTRPSRRRTRSSRVSRPVASRPPRSPPPWRRSAPTAPTRSRRSTSAPAAGARTGRPAVRGSRLSGPEASSGSRACRTLPTSSRPTWTSSRTRSSTP